MHGFPPGAQGQPMPNAMMRGPGPQQMNGFPGPGQGMTPQMSHMNPGMMHMQAGGPGGGPQVMSQHMTQQVSLFSCQQFLMAVILLHVLTKVASCSICISQNSQTRRTRQTRLRLITTSRCEMLIKRVRDPSFPVYRLRALMNPVLRPQILRTTTRTVNGLVRHLWAADSYLHQAWDWETRGQEDKTSCRG